MVDSDRKRVQELMMETAATDLASSRTIGIGMINQTLPTLKIPKKR